MLTYEENELLTRVGRGTPMGEFFRRYWIPALLTEEIPAPDSPPVRVRLLGEDLLAFRDSAGKIGLVSERCAHRGASLFYGRNEECGLRCIYHGWKYDTQGNILETPPEPENSMIRYHVKLPAYPTHEVNGVIMTYMGPSEKMPLVPNFEWTTLPAEHVTLSKLINECNWLQSVEGDSDSSHVEFLHLHTGTSRTMGDTFELIPGFGGNLGWETELGPWHVTVAAHRFVAEDQKYVRTNTFIPPCVALPPVGRTLNGLIDGLAFKYQVPVDDYTTARFDIWTSRSAPWRGGHARRNREDSGPDFRKYWNRSNDYMIDREKQRTKVYSGIDGSTHIQDACVTETMGPINDRTLEHLGASDTQIALMRKFLLKAVREFQEGKEPPGLAFDAASNTFGNLYTVDALLPLDVPWNDREQVMAHAVEPSPYGQSF